MDPLATISTRTTPQTEQADPSQVLNNAGGYTFPVDDATRLRRFLTLGTTGGTYYVSESDLTKDNADLVLTFARDRTGTLVDEIREISLAGRAPRQNPCLFALAAACSLGDDAGRKRALDAVQDVVRTGYHLFVFIRYVKQFRGWGRGLRRAISNWYLSKPVDDLAYQLVKYRQREGWSQRDLLRLAHPKTTEVERSVLFDWTCGRGLIEGADGLSRVEGFEKAQTASLAAVPGLVREHRLSWEMLPDTAVNDPGVWEALLEVGVPQGALIRQLPRLTRLGLLDPMGDWTKRVCDQLADPERLKRARVHPIAVLMALRTYASGQSARGQGTWSPSAPVVDALDAAFYASFGAVEPMGKRVQLALDISGSMGMHAAGQALTCREATAALALVTANVESQHEIVGFSHHLMPLSISPRQRLDDAIRTVSNLPFGRTDCSLPMVDALQRNAKVDVFVVLTDNETYFGPIHPHQALRQYREKTGIDARLVVVSMVPSRFSIADPTDPGQLDVSGFDAAVPTLISDFGRGEL